MLMMRGAVGVGFVALGAKLWRMQTAQGSDFENVAEGNVLRFERLKAPRGRIVDRNGLALAENRRVWTVRIVPDRLPDDEDKRLEILDSIAETLELGEALVLDRRQIPLGSEAAVVNQLEERLEFADRDLFQELQDPATKIVLLLDELEPQAAKDYLNQLDDIPGVRVLNVIDYQLAIHTYDDQPMEVKRDVERETAMMIAANAVRYPGVIVDDNTLVRQYPAGESFSHILGYVGPITREEFNGATTVTGTPIYDPDDYAGRGGVEEKLEQELRGTKGGRWIQVDSNDIERFELLDRRREPIPGLSVQLTIDREFQQRVTEALQEGIDEAHIAAVKEDREPVGSGVAIAMNPRNGEILAMVSLPSFDNQLFVDGISNQQFKAYIDDPYSPLLNKAINGTYPPGSTFKPLVASAGLQEGVIDTEKTYDCKGDLRVPWSWDETQGNDYLCWVGRPGHGPLNVYSAIADSCDVYFYNVGTPRAKPEEPANADFVHYYNPGEDERHYFEGLGIDRLGEYLRRDFGFGSPLGIDLAGEAEGLVPNSDWLWETLEETWSIGDTINVSIGQGHLLCTPLQLLYATAAIANRGTLWRPRLVRGLVREDGRMAREFPPSPISKLTVSPEHLETVRLGMRRTVTSGTGTGKITIQDPPVAGKSGTAEFGNAVNGIYRRSHAWFTGFGSFDDPEICVAVLVVDGIAGSTYAGPVADKILKAYFS